jgi:hypothetical protein
MKPVITTLKQFPPKESAPRAEPLVLCVDGDTRDWAWVGDAYGASYRRGETTLRLIEVHEYEGPATLDVLVVDDDGLPVKGVEFYYDHPGAPDIAGGEWHGQGVRKVSGADGRISFSAVGDACTAGTCDGAIWPRGKGDLLEGLGLLSGTNNRHLNGVWQLVAEGTPPLPDPEPEEPEEEPEDEDDVEKDEPTDDPEEDDAVAREPKIDPRIKSLLELDLQGTIYKLKEVVWMDPDESHGLHHIFVDVVDKDGRRLAGEKIRVSWSDGETVIPVEEKPGEPWGGNYAMYATMGAYAVEVVGTSGASDKVGGLGMGTPQEPHIKHHTSFGLTFRKQIS